MQPQDLQRAFYEMLMESQFWSPQQLVDYQRTQLSQLLRHAKKNVPFYEKRLDAVFTASGDIDWDRWEEIPIVKRADMVEQREAMLARERPKGHGASGTISSSGSTGRPITVTNNWLTMLAGNANRWRGHHWHGLDWSGTYTARHDFDPRSEYPHGWERGGWGPPWDETATQGRVYQLSRNAHMPQIIEFLQRTGSRYFSTGPKTMHVMALEIERTSDALRLDCVIPHGEHVSAADRAAYKRVFGARTLEIYSSKEGGQVGYSCPHGPGLHINSESVLVEIVDAEGHAMPPGETGRVVLTPFVSTAQPLIRYDQGDFARFGPTCACGRTLPVLAAIEGRSTAIFTHPDGRSVSRMLSEPARDMLKCTFWQIAQVGPLEFEVRYVPKDWDVPGDEAAADALYRTIFFADSDVRFIRVRQILPTPAGKYLEYVNEWARRQV